MDGISGTKSPVKITMLILWLVAVAGILYGIQSRNVYSAKKIPTVAEISKPRGEVMFRNENQSRWNFASSGTSLYDGDRISTGKGSSVVTKFEDGRKLTLGPDSVVSISTITHSDNGVTFLVNLVKGSVIADTKVVCKGCREIVLKAGGESFKVSKGKKEGFFRDSVSSKVERFNGTGPIPVRSANEEDSTSTHTLLPVFAFKKLSFELLVIRV